MVVRSSILTDVLFFWLIFTLGTHGILAGCTSMILERVVDVKRLGLEIRLQFSSVHSVVSDSLWPHGLQHPGLPLHHQLPEFTQTHVHWVGDAIQPSHPLSSPSLPAFNHSQHQGLFKWVSTLHQVAKVLEFQLQHQYFQWVLRTDFL